MIKFITQLLCHHWFLPLQTGTIIRETWERKDEVPIFDPKRERCCFCGKLRLIKNKNP